MHMPLNNVITIKDGIKMIFCVLERRCLSNGFDVHISECLDVCVSNEELNKHFRMLASSFSATPQCAIEITDFTLSHPKKEYFTTRC